MSLLLAAAAGAAWGQTAQPATTPDTVELPTQSAAAADQNQETFRITAKRVHDAQVAHYGGSAQRSDGWRMFPGYLPEKGAFTTTVDLDQRTVTDADRVVSGATSGQADVDSPAVPFTGQPAQP